MPSYTGVKSLIFTTPTLSASIDTMSLDIAAAMRELGIGARILLCTGETLNAEFVTMLLSELEHHNGPAFIMDINGRYDFKMGDSNFFDALGIPKFSFLTDNPSALIPRFRDFPKAFLGGMVSREHLDHCTTFGLPPERCIFFPHGGPPPLTEQLQTNERDINILFSGNIETVPPFKNWLETTFPNQTQLHDLLIGIEEQLISPHTHIFSAVIDALGNSGSEISPELLTEMFTPLERYLINRERFNILAAIKKHRVTVIGSVSENVAKALPHHHFLGAKNYTEVMNAMARAKISLNIVPSFRNGGHERMFYSLAYGCLLLTDRNDFLEEDSINNAFVNFFPENLDHLDHMLGSWLNEDAYLDSERPAATAQYAKRHTWRQRLLPVLEHLDRHHWQKKTG